MEEIVVKDDTVIELDIPVHNQSAKFPVTTNDIFKTEEIATYSVTTLQENMEILDKEYNGLGLGIFFAFMGAPVLIASIAFFSVYGYYMETYLLITGIVLMIASVILFTLCSICCCLDCFMKNCCCCCYYNHLG